MVNPDFLTIEPIYPWKCTFYDCLPIASLIIQSYQSNKYFQACVGPKNLHDLRHALSDNGNILPDAKDICAINSPLDHINTLKQVPDMYKDLLYTYARIVHTKLLNQQYLAFKVYLKTELIENPKDKRLVAFICWRVKRGSSNKRGLWRTYRKWIEVRNSARIIDFRPRFSYKYAVEENTIVLENLCVCPQYQRQGIGKHMIEFFMHCIVSCQPPRNDRDSTDGPDKIVLFITDESALPFFENLGFKAEAQKVVTVGSNIAINKLVKYL
jgi:GNAT superfamily N-acetyltransferase